MSMVEKIARIIDPAPWDRFTWCIYPPAPLRRWQARKAARRVIEAMREPTEAMLKAGEIPTREVSLGNGQTVHGLGLGAAAWSIWPKMIDAALAESSPLPPLHNL